MRIKAIKTSGPFKLISAAHVGHMSGMPVEVEVVFMDYKDHELRYFSTHGVYSYFCQDFKHALKAILSDTISSLVQIL